MTRKPLKLENRKPAKRVWVLGFHWKMSICMNWE
jgi:hypothetical protein